MYRSQYDITPHREEEKLRRDNIHFPRALPSNTRTPMHQLDHSFVDRQFMNDRKQNDLLSVQNSYMQQYQIHELQQRSFGFNVVEQRQVDRMMEKKMPSGDRLLDRNNDDAMLFGRRNQQAIPVQFMPTPTDTRKEKIDLNNEREPMAKVFGEPLRFKEW